MTSDISTSLEDWFMSDEVRPVGLTWEDVDLLRGVADYWHPQDGDGAEWDEYAGRQAALRNLADRIAALLPPRP
jgi:hypothetical protein